MPFCVHDVNISFRMTKSLEVHGNHFSNQRKQRFKNIEKFWSFTLSCFVIIFCGLFFEFQVLVFVTKSASKIEKKYIENVETQKPETLPANGTGDAAT